ncbi:winged helix-turn-helix domain-containing protein [Streptomyces sp. NPDC048275]|uniref:GntR family transcriptional regulator n=1 Tax=Streptomyces sp. NPDC048275 TaxID=3155629 RepID=UPI0033D2B500
MTLPLDRDHRPPYVQVAEYLRRQIQTGVLKPGDQIPPSRELQEKFGIASATVQNAFRMLKNEGLIYGVQGRGSFVRRPEGEPEQAQDEPAEEGVLESTPPKPTPSETRYFTLAMDVEELKHELAGLKQDMAKMVTLMQKMADHIDEQES